MSTAIEWETYFQHVGYNNHEDLLRFVLWLDVKGYQIEDKDRPTVPELAEIEAEHFLGQYESPAHFAEESLGNAYAYELEALPAEIRSAIDWASVYDNYLRHDCNDVELIGEQYRWLIWHAH